MQIVINISEDNYKLIKDGNCCGVFSYEIYNAIKNGTVLPKRHGDLKDADAMINKLCTNEASELFGSITCAEILDFINDEKTIIKADADKERNDKE